MAFTPHQDRGLQGAFRNKPWQGADPQKAEFICCGLDANFATDIASSPVYHDVLEYLADAVLFWQRHGVHHPFLLPGSCEPSHQRRDCRDTCILPIAPLQANIYARPTSFNSKAFVAAGTSSQ